MTDIMARTVWGESRGQGAAGMAGVAWVVKNRAAHPGWWGEDIDSVCLKPYQFDVWLQNDPNCDKCKAVTLDDHAFAEASRICAGVLSGAIPDPTNGATSYYDTSIQPPKWAVGKTPSAAIGAFRFFKV